MRLLLGLIALILLTTLSAGIPAYWLARSQLERQAWSQVDSAQRATGSLLQAEKARLENLAGLFAERPTLQRLIREENLTELQPYLQDFRTRSQLDILLYCDSNNQLLAGSLQLPDCFPGDPTGFQVVEGRATLLARQAVVDETNNERLGETVAGVWLDEPFLRQLAADTGAQQGILSPDGIRLASSISVAGQPAEQPTAADLPVGSGKITLDGSRFYALYTPLVNDQGEAVLVSEVALPVDDLIATENRALLILAASTGFIAALGVLLGIWYVRQLYAPLQELTSVAEQISQGDLLAPIPLITSPEEVSTLATALHKSQASMLQALQERSVARDWLDALIQSIVEGVVTLDEEGRITFFSQGAEALTGWNRAEALGKHIDEVFPLADGHGDGLFDLLPPPGNKGQIHILVRSGKSIVLAVTRASLVPPDSDSAQVALVLRDVTQEEALRGLRAYFLANISHEFRTPLSTLNASMELLLDPAEALSADEMRELIKPSYLSLRTLQTLIDNLLESSSIEAGQFTLKRRAIAANQVLEYALRLAGPLLERRRQPITISEPAELPEIQADPSRLTLALVNLLVNASKYSPAGQPIDIRIEQIADAVRFSITDRGPGIPATERMNLFRRFVRLNSVDEEQYGIGLGLFVVKTTVEAHGGCVGVEDNPAGGSIFWFELPVSEVESTP